VFSVISVVKLSIEISEGIWVLDYKCKTLNVKFFFFEIPKK
jgi:hypothetical protein